MNNNKYSAMLPSRKNPRKKFFLHCVISFMIFSLCLIFFISIKNDFFANIVQQHLTLHKSLPPPEPGKQDLVVLLRDNPLSYNQDINGNTTGFEHDLVIKLAEKLNVKAQFLLVDNAHFDEFLANEPYHLAISWLSADDNSLQSESNLINIAGKDNSRKLKINKNRLTQKIIATKDVLLQNEYTKPIKSTQQLKGKTVHVIAGTRQAQTAKQLKQKVPDLEIVEVKSGNELDLLENLANNDLPLHKNVNYVIADEYVDLMSNHIFPNVRKTLTLANQNKSIVWILGKQFAFNQNNQNNQNNKNAKNAKNAKNEQNSQSWESITQNFIADLHKTDYLTKLNDIHFGHLKRLTAIDIATFLSDIEKILPRYRKYFYEAEKISGLDWRLIAALSYQESHWDPNATSPTNVRGIMMLTEDTADRLKVSNRLNARQSIKAGAVYLNYLKDAFVGAEEPDKTWLALAAYNTGLGGVLGARKLAKKRNANPNNWYEMKKVLPLMARPGYAESVGSVKVRGGEAVILTENVRSYYGILQRYDDEWQTQNQPNIEPQNLLEANKDNKQNLLTTNN